MKYLVTIALSVVSIGGAQAVSLINLSFSGAMTPGQQQTFVDAAKFWNTVITGYDLSYNWNGQAQAHGLTITASLPEIDGIGSVLGSAGPTSITYYDNNPLGLPSVALQYATTGIMQFDAADVGVMVASKTFYGVVLHEMAHVIGFGTLWTTQTNLNSTVFNLYADGTGQYVGANALSQWQSEFNRPFDTFVPVELGGGSGTANGHWNENDGGYPSTGIRSADTGMDLSNELMTGWASETFFVSRATLGAIDDLGYTVDYSLAGVVVPEASCLQLGLVAGMLLLRRRR